MNPANLQLEGLYLVLAALNQTLVDKGLLEKSDIDLALKKAEQAALGEDRAMEDLSPAQRDAIAFPSRLLQLANTSQAHTLSFYELARQVGQTKPAYNDQR